MSHNVFNSHGNKNFVSEYEASVKFVGGLPYFQPNGWIRYGLNINKYN